MEFVALTIFESLSAVRDFAGEDYETAVISTDAKQVLKRFEERAAHYEIIVAKKRTSVDVESCLARSTRLASVVLPGLISVAAVRHAAPPSRAGVGAVQK